jgi:hypothetical protein
MLFAFAPVRSAEPETAGNGANANHLYFHPFITLITLLSDQVPTGVALTYERTLSTPGNAFVWQAQLVFGDGKAKDSVDFSQYGTAHYLGLRHYFGDGYRGFYLQGSGAFSISGIKAEQKDNPNGASGLGTGIGALGYLGYKWTHVFFDAGAGFQGAKGDIELDNGEEVSVAHTGPLFDFNLGIGF